MYGDAGALGDGLDLVALRGLGRPGELARDLREVDDVERKLVGDSLECLALQRLVAVFVGPEEERERPLEMGARDRRPGGHGRRADLEYPATGENEGGGAAKHGEEEG